MAFSPATAALQLAKAASADNSGLLKQGELMLLPVSLKPLINRLTGK
jgi:hypothetical protein